MTLHLTEDGRHPLCGYWAIFHSVMMTRKLKDADCKVCISVLKNQLRPPNSMTWTNESWRKFVGSESDEERD